MTDTQTTTITISQEIVKKDRSYDTAVKSADGSLKNAKQKKAKATAEQNRWRWEMTVCPFGPQFSQREYADAVGQSHQTIMRGVNAWQTTIDADKSVQGGPVCPWGEPHHLPEIATEDAEDVTDEEAEQHAQDRLIADNGAIKATAIELLALHFQVSTNTFERHYRSTVKEAIARLQAEHDVKDMTIEEIKPLLNEIARVLRAEDKLNTHRRNTVQRWMADNRGVDNISDIKPKEIDSKMERIDIVAARGEMDWDDAAEEVRVQDAKASEAAKIKNEMARAARMAIVDLMGAVADVKKATTRVIKYVRAIEDAGIVISDDERTISVDDLDFAEATLHLARAALTGNSGTDWDVALTSLQGGR
jgi:hypothetical protein